MKVGELSPSASAAACTSAAFEPSSTLPVDHTDFAFAFLQERGVRANDHFVMILDGDMLSLHETNQQHRNCREHDFEVVS